MKFVCGMGCEVNVGMSKPNPGRCERHGSAFVYVKALGSSKPRKAMARRGGEVRPTIEEYRERLKGLSNAELVDKSGAEILGAAVMARFRSNDGWADDCAGACYDEAVRRGNPDLYQRGYNEAVRSQGHLSLVGKVTTPVCVGEPGTEGGGS